METKFKEMKRTVEIVSKVLQIAFGALGALALFKALVVAIGLVKVALFALGASNPFGIILLAIGGVVGALIGWKDDIISVGDENVRVGIVITAVWETLSRRLVKFIDSIITKINELKGSLKFGGGGEKDTEGFFSSIRRDLKTAAVLFTSPLLTEKEVQGLFTQIELESRGFTPKTIIPTQPPGRPSAPIEGPPIPDRLLFDEMTAEEEFRARIKAANEAEKLAKETAEFNALQSDLKKAIRQEEKDALNQEIEAVKAAEEARLKAIADLEKQKNAVEALGEETSKLGQIGSQFGSAFSSALGEMANGTATAEEAMKRLVQQIIDMILQILVLQPLAQSISGAFGAIGGLGGPSSVATPGVPIPVPVKAAKGSFINKRTIMAGEAGPEAILPLMRDSTGRLGVGGESGGKVVNVSMTVNTPNPDAFRSSQRQMSALLRKAAGGI